MGEVGEEVVVLGVGGWRRWWVGFLEFGISLEEEFRDQGISGGSCRVCMFIYSWYRDFSYLCL